MRIQRLLVICLVLFAGVMSVSAHDGPADVSGIDIRGAWARATAFEPMAGMDVLPGTTASVYMTIDNTGENDLTLTHVTTAIAPEAMLHNTTIDESGVMRMSMMDEGVLIAAGESFAFEQMGPHIMLMDVTRDLFPGDAITLVLHFTDPTDHVAELLVGVPVYEFMPDPVDLAVTQTHFHEAMDDGDATVMFIIENNSAQLERLVEIVPVAPASPAPAFDDMTLWQTVAIDADAIEAGLSGAAATTDLNALIAELAETLPGSALALDLRFESGLVLRTAVPVAVSFEATGSGDHSDHGG